VRLLYAHDLPRFGIEQTYRHARMLPVVVFIVTIASAIAWALYIWLQDEALILYWPSFGAALVALFTLSGARAAWRSTNWLMKIASDGVYIKFRSYLNHHFPDDAPTVVHLVPADIASVGIATERVTLPNRDGGDMSATMRFLDIRLAQPPPESMVQAIEYERRRPPPGRRMTTKHHDYPLRFVGSETLRILWSAAVRPGIPHAVADLGARYPRGDDAHIERTPWHDMAPAEQESLILELCERGETVTAIRLARMRYGMNLTEAKRFVDGIMYGESGV